MIRNASSGAGCAAWWCRTARLAPVWLLFAGSAGAIEPSGSSVPGPRAADPFVERGAPIQSERPAPASTPYSKDVGPSKDSAGVAHLSPIATPYVPYHATATSPWSPRAVDPPPPDAYTAPSDETATPGSIFESIFDPNKLVPVILPEAPAAPQAATGDEPARIDAASPVVTQISTDAFAAPVVETGPMTPVTFGPAKNEKPANTAGPAKPAKKKTAAKPVDDVDRPSPVEPAATKPAAVRPPVAAKYHLPQPPIPLP
jgi:hypothetical protein